MCSVCQSSCFILEYILQVCHTLRIQGTDRKMPEFKSIESIESAPSARQAPRTPSRFNGFNDSSRQVRDDPQVRLGLKSTKSGGRWSGASRIFLSFRRTSSVADRHSSGHQCLNCTFSLVKLLNLSYVCVKTVKIVSCTYVCVNS